MAKKNTAKTVAKKKTMAKKKAARKKSATAGTKPGTIKKASARKPAKKSILKRKFDTWVPDILFFATPDEAYEKGFSAPPVFPSKKKDSARLKRLLLKPANLEVMEKEKPKKTPAPKKPAAEKKTAPTKAKKTGPPVAKKKPAVSIKTLLMQKFASWTPESLDTPGTIADETAVFTAPPAIDEADPDRAEWLKGLLLKKIDFKTPVEPLPPDEEIKADPGPLPETEKPETKMAKPQTETETKPETESPSEPVPDAKSKSEAESEPRVETKSESVPEAASEPEQETKPEPAKVETLPAADKPEGVSIPGPLKALITVLSVIIALLVTASLMNIRHYYIIPTRTGIEVLKGTFSPKGQEKIAFLPMAKAPEKIKDVYTKSEVYSIIYLYNIKKADKLSRLKIASDLNEAKKYVDKARAYALSSADIDRAGKQLERIQAKLKAIAPAPGK